jgi:hypothetical protein
MRGEEPEVLEHTTITPQGIHIGEQKVFQFHPLLGNIRRDLVWMSYRGK